MNQTAEKIRNIAIIAHVDHGKTTLVDAILKQSNTFRENEDMMSQTQILDSGELEREKAITITAKNISVTYDGYKINIIDTPGHADFGGEVERTLNMAEGCILLVDAQEGPMIQTRVVLKKALELGLKPIVVINKIDKKLADTAKTIDKVQDLFLELASDESQLEFPILYAISREGKVFTEMPSGDLTVPDSIDGTVYPLLDTIVNVIPHPSGDPDGSFQMQISSLQYDNHQGTLLIGKIKRGQVKVGDPVILVSTDPENQPTQQGKVKILFVRKGLGFDLVESASAGEIIAIAGIESSAIGATLCSLDNPDPLPALAISPPSIEVKFEANTSPFVGKEGEFVTARLLSKRLNREAQTNVNISIKQSTSGSFSVMVRGELQLSILIETLRREGYEFQIRKPSIIMKKIDGKIMEPQEELSIEVPEEFTSNVIQELSNRDAELVSMKEESKKVFFEYKILTRKLLGLRSELFVQTKGKLIMNSAFSEYVPFKTGKDSHRNGVLISSATGETRDYSLNTIQERGTLFVGSSEQVYEGMIIGINKYEEDLEVNPTKERKKSGVRVSHAIITISNVRAPKILTLEFAVSFLAEDELLEVTPKSLRLRKQFLTQQERDWSKRKTLTEFAKKQMGIS